MVGVRNPLPGVVYHTSETLKRYVAAGALPETGLIEELMASFARHADRIALWVPSGPIRYAELDEITDKIAAALLSLGLKPLERVLFQVANVPELIPAFLGCLKAGLIPICTLAAHRESEIGYLGRHAAAAAHIVQGDDPKFDLQAFALKMQAEIPSMRHILSLRGEACEGVVALEELAAAQDADAAKQAVAGVERDPFQVAIFQLSGGTTGVPKIIPRMQNDYLVNATLGGEIMGFRPDDVMFMPMPIIHNACMICFWLPTLLTGAAYALAEDMTPASWLRCFQMTRPTYVGLNRALIPRLDAVIEADPAVLEPIRAFWCPDAAQRLRLAYGKPAWAMFGMTEGTNMYCREGDPEEALDWTVGRPMSPLDEVRLLKPGTNIEAEAEEIGEFTCRGPYTLAGYYDAEDRNREAFTADGFYKSGDLIIRRVIEGTSYYAFAGRTKDVVDRGSEKINCEEVETAVSTHASVAGCAVVGMPDPVLGERVCAYLVLRDGHDAPDVPEMQAHLTRKGLAKFKWPERIETIDALPLTKVGKLDKAVLRQDILVRMKQGREVPA